MTSPSFGSTIWTMNSTMVRGREELADLAPEGAAQEPLEGDALDVFAGVGEVVALQLSDDFAAVAASG